MTSYQEGWEDNKWNGKMNEKKLPILKTRLRWFILFWQYEINKIFITHLSLNLTSKPSCNLWLYLTESKSVSSTNNLISHEKKCTDIVCLLEGAGLEAWIVRGWIPLFIKYQDKQYIILYPHKPEKIFYRQFDRWAHGYHIW